MDHVRLSKISDITMDGKEVYIEGINVKGDRCTVRVNKDFIQDVHVHFKGLPSIKKSTNCSFTIKDESPSGDDPEELNNEEIANVFTGRRVYQRY